MYYKCPHCSDPPGKYFTTRDKLNKHIKRVHQGEPQLGSENENPPPDPGGVKNPPKKSLSQELKIEKPPQPPTEDIEFECSGCHYKPLTQGQEVCPGCGEALVWEGIG